MMIDMISIYNIFLLIHDSITLNTTRILLHILKLIDFFFVNCEMYIYNTSLNSRRLNFLKLLSFIILLVMFELCSSQMLKNYNSSQYIYILYKSLV